MKYTQELFIRVGIAVLLFVIPVNVFYLLFAKITLWGSLSIFYLLGYPIQVNGHILSLNGQGLEFVSACVATSAYYLLALLVLLTKDIKLKDRFYVFISGGLLILLMNLIRIDILIYLLIEFGKNWFENVHIIFWHFVSSIYVAAVWIFLTYKFKIKSVPVYSDFKFLLSKSVFRKNVKKRRK